ncbi:hypothetical protein [Methanolapillus ohkumae]|uniref:Uncharacterized protein n=1 Tax=Methanolapillus ohkumae TaxID=3028298 RepID=A0AA96ZXB8_9EURY|nr:hypothetical protein MsAm2_06530 [Methanosarcinaceae archaeon Am2]
MMSALVFVLIYFFIVFAVFVGAALLLIKAVNDRQKDQEEKKYKNIKK